MDTAGNAYVTGFTTGFTTSTPYFPTTAGAYQTTFGGGYDDAFVTKLNPTGTALVYSTYLGGTSYDTGTGIAVDTAGNAYVTGTTGSADFPTTLGAYQTTYGGYDDAFVTKLNPTGTALVYSTYLGGTSYDTGTGIAVDTAGNAYVTGTTGSADFPTTLGAYQTTYGGNGDAFVTKLNPTGTALVYSTYLGGTSDDVGYGIAVDTAGNAYVTGYTTSYTTSPYFPTTAGAYQTSFGGGYDDAFVTKLNPTGTALVYSTYLGGTSDDVGYGIAVDTAGDAYVAGYTTSPFPTTAGAYQTTFGGGYDDAFVTKLNPTGTALVYSTYLGGTSYDTGTGIAVDTAGNAYVTGTTGSADFPTTLGAYQTTYGGNGDAFVTKLNPMGTALVYSTYLGGTGNEVGYGIAVDTAGNAYVTGFTTSTTDFPTTAGAYQTSFGGGDDAFVAKFALSPVRFGVTPLFDQDKPHQSGSTIPIKIEVTDALGNVGSSSLPVAAVSVVGPDGNPVLPTAPGNSQPGNLFTFDPTTGTYQFNLKTKGYKPGSYTLFFTVGDDPKPYSVSFVIR